MYAALGCGYGDGNCGDNFVAADGGDICVDVGEGGSAGVVVAVSDGRSAGVLVGGTLPSLARALIGDRESLPNGGGLLYTMNTAGGVAGALLISFCVGSGARVSGVKSPEKMLALWVTDRGG